MSTTAMVVLVVILGVAVVVIEAIRLFTADKSVENDE